MKYYLTDHNRVLADVRKALGEQIVSTPEEADKVIVWQDVIGLSMGIVKLAKMKGKPSIMMQHGRWGTSLYYPPFNQPILADYICVWGQQVKDKMLTTGISPKRLHITSSTIFKYLIPRKPHQGINIVFTPEHWDADVPENHLVYDELKKIKEVNLIVKTVNLYDKDNYENVIYTDRGREEHLKICAEVLSTADIVIGVMEGTFELLAQVLDIPVIIVDIWQPKSFRGDEGYKYYNRMKSKAAKYIPLEILQDEIRRQIENPGEFKEARQKVALSEGGLQIKNPLQEILKVIKKA